MAKKIHLLGIDPQNSFCEYFDATLEYLQIIMHTGELYVRGAPQDMERAANLINELGHAISKIFVTMDDHLLSHISNTVWFKKLDGSTPEAFTYVWRIDNQIWGRWIGNITEEFELTTTNPDDFEWTLHYLSQIEKQGRRQHMLFPPHSLRGTRGHNICDRLYPALFNWESKNIGHLEVVRKGWNQRFEHFGAIRAEVIDPSDPSSDYNEGLCRRVNDADEIIALGEANTHCVPATLEDMEYCLRERMGVPDFAKRLVFINNCSSPVKGFEEMYQGFLDRMIPRGMRSMTAEEYINQNG